MNVQSNNTSPLFPFSLLAGELKDVRDAFRNAESELQFELAIQEMERIIEAVERKEAESGA